MPERLIKKDAKMLFAELYQICGALGCNAKILDNLSAASRGLKPPHKTLLPFVDRESVPAETLVREKIAEYVEKHYKVEWDKMGNTGADDYWDTATREELYHFGRFRAFEDLQDFIESNFST